MKYLLFVFAVIILASCEKKNTSAIKIVKETVNNQKVEYQYDSIKKVKQGYYKFFYENGQVSIEKTYVNDTANGYQKEFFPSGKLSGEFKVVAGKFEGEFKYFHENGKVKQVGKYLNNAIEGELKSYYENGSIKESVMMVDNLEKGPFTEFYESGKPKVKGEFLEGVNTEFCVLEKFKEDGTPESRMLCNGKGVCCTIWTAEKGDQKPNNPMCIKLMEEMKDKCK